MNPPLGVLAHKVAGVFCASLGQARVFGLRSSLETQAHWNHEFWFNPLHDGTSPEQPELESRNVPPSHQGVRHGSCPPCSVPHCCNPCPMSRRLFTQLTRVERSR